MNISTQKQLWLIILICLTISSCNFFQGIHKSEKIDTQQISKFERKFNINGETYLVDSSYQPFIISKKTEDKHMTKNHLQPLQALYFDKNGKLISYAINCYAEPGLFNLKWNKNKNFNVFPPITLAPIDNLFSLGDIYSILKNPNSQTQLNLNENYYTVVVFWNKTLRKYSKSLIKTIKRNLKLTNSTVRVIYVNNDNYLFHLFQSDSNKQKNK